ncbi:MAG: nitroreductase family protein [Deltaproteobacteria bacterium]|nr:nitroreductase family protein [Deltaproteobacteria bacterium]MBI3389927.1 nitroreductase family protein [Deltaproteobacteria bacterium]
MAIDLFEAMRTMRTIRRFESRPIPADVLTEIITAATWASSGSNSQPWGFLVVCDAGLKRSLRDLYLARFALAEKVYRALNPQQQRMMRGARHLAEHLDEAPVLLFPCVDKHRYPMIFDERGETRDPTTLYASILPAVQNLLLAARAHGIGGCLTTILRFADAEVRELLAIPDHVVTTVMIPLGYARDKFGPVVRRAAAEVTYLDRWGEPLTL